MEPTIKDETTVVPDVNNAVTVDDVGQDSGGRGVEDGPNPPSQVETNNNVVPETDHPPTLPSPLPTATAATSIEIPSSNDKDQITNVEEESNIIQEQVEVDSVKGMTTEPNDGNIVVDRTEEDVDVVAKQVSQAGDESSPMVENDAQTGQSSEVVSIEETKTKEGSDAPLRVETENKESNVVPLLELTPTHADTANTVDAAVDKVGSPNVTITDSVQATMKIDTTTTTSSSSPSSSIAQSKGAQIILNRFSSWRISANESAASLIKSKTPVLQENAKQAQEYAQRIFQNAHNTVVAPTRIPTSITSRFQGSSGTVSTDNNTSTSSGVSTGGPSDVSNSMANTTSPKESENAQQQHSELKVEKSEAGTTNQSSHATESDESSTTKDGLTGTSDDGTNTNTQMDGPVGTVQQGQGATTDPSMVDSSGDYLGYGADSATTILDPATRERMRAVITKASVAGTIVAESVATSFRGRYTADVTAGPYSLTDDVRPERRPSPESQMAVILKSRAGEHMQEILDRLSEHEFAMLLGRGMLGVNLKQCYLKNHGIFVDYLVEGGQAQASGLVRSGDLLVRLGETDIRKGTIKDVPYDIANAKRPAVLVLATGMKVALERVNYVDVAVAMMHRARRYYQERGSLSNLPSAGSFNSTDVKVEPTGTATSVLAKEEKRDDLVSSATPKSVSSVEIPIHNNVESFYRPTGPNMEIRKEFVDEVPLRCFDKFIVSDLCQVLDMDTNFRASIRNAFFTCALDSRRLPFLARHLAVNDESSEGMTPDGTNMTPSAQLMLFLELASFLDLYDVTPVSLLRESAGRIAHKFFLPTKIGNRLQPPLFDFHHIVPDSSLRHLEFVLNGKSQFIPRDLFLDFQKSVADSLVAGPFLSFLASADCARMRAYLRDTAPYVNLPLKNMIDSIVAPSVNSEAATAGSSASGAKNCLAYVLLYLICRMEKECSGEYDFGLEDEINRRILGAANDLCCTIFIKRTLLPILESTKSKSNSVTDGGALSEADMEKLVNVVEQFWDFYIANAVESFPRSTRIELSKGRVRNIMEKVSEGARTAPNTKDIVDGILNSNLAEEASSFAAELLYDYAANLHTKFRDHKFHEWMCSELCKVLASDPYGSHKQEIPVLPHGCVKRLLRKAELPGGVSSHKPYKTNTNANDEDERRYHNADWAVVFGSSVGRDLASQMPVPGLDSSDVRRYTCLQVALDRELDQEDFRPEEVLPATFESYAVVPPSKPKPFQSLADRGRVSIDGWEVSLVTFSIPNAESSSSGDDTSSALFGVSLCFQRSSISPEPDAMQGQIPTQLICQPEDASVPVDPENASQWISPISFASRTDSEDGNTVRRLNVSSELPVFASHLEGTTWADRVREDQYHDQANPLVIGVALVSRRNVIFSMRDTLSRLLFDFSREADGQTLEEAMTKAPSCGALIEVLGAFAHQDHESNTLRLILDRYLRFSSSVWVDRPIADQEKAFELHSLRQLTDCLPPTPLALMFVTALLEQKIVLSSSRRSVLHAACIGLKSLLQPLKWSHLMVPLVPGALANDLIQYPAPFILGVPSEDADTMDLLGNLPRDVTLVDLDVGRVILAPSFGLDNDMVRGTSDAVATARALRSQVLYLAQGLGTVFGNSLRSESWLCDGPTLDTLDANNCNRQGITRYSPLEQLRLTARGFLTELLGGSESCCYWIEEASQTFGSSIEPTVLFDEDRFFEIKNYRATKSCTPLFQGQLNIGELALSLEDFDLVLESFLRCQAMSIYISSRPKTMMLYF